MDLEHLSKWMGKSSKEFEDDMELSNHLGEMQTWLRNLEQHVLSLNGRLGAIEQSLSPGDHEKRSIETQKKSSMSPCYQSINSDLTDNHFSHLNLEITHLSNDLKKLKNQIESIESSTIETEKTNRLLKKKKQTPMITMKFGKKEIPFELSGLIGGFICFLVAALTMTGATDIVLSPYFLTGIGLLLISGTFLRTDLSLSFIKKVIKILLPQSVTSRMYKSDSRS